MEVGFELTPRHRAAERLAVAYEVEVRLLKVDDTLTVPCDVRVANVPLVGDRPVEDPSASRNLVHLEWEPFGYRRQSLADSVAGDAPAERKQLFHEKAGPRAAV